MKTAQGHSIDARLVNPIIQATMSVLSTMACTQVSPRQITAHTDFSPVGDLSAIITILGAEGEGMVGLSFNEGFAKVVVARLLGSDPSVLSPDDVADGIGELVNMISGNAKTALSASSSIPYKLSLPTVIRGANHEICRQKTGSPFLMMEFEGEGERFYLQLTFKQYSFNY